MFRLLIILLFLPFVVGIMIFIIVGVIQWVITGSAGLRDKYVDYCFEWVEQYEK